MYAAHERRALAAELARAFLQGRWRAEDLAERGAGSLDRWPAWMNELAFAVVSLDRVVPTGRQAEVAELVETFLRDRPADPDGPEPPQIQRHVRARPRGPAGRWPVARIESVGALADELQLSSGQLAWLADVRGLERGVDAEKLRNYRYRWVPRRAGLPRLLEAPKARLKEIQRWVLRHVLDHVPPHPAAHGFTRGRSALTNARQHTGQRVVLGLDLRDFFASVAAARVFGIFRALGYEPAVAHVLTGLCTNTTPTAAANVLPRPRRSHLVGPHFRLGRQLATPHLPQGAPTSPALANLAAFALDRRLTGLGHAFSLRYSRYADDLTFSGPGLRPDANRAVLELADRIARSEGFALHAEKSMLRTDAQRQLVTGIVVNATTNSPRDEYDRLRATLHRIAHDGPSDATEAQAQLRGRIAWVASLNPRRAEKLRRLFDAITWEQPRGDDGGVSND